MARKVYSREWRIAFTARAIGLLPTPNNQIARCSSRVPARRSRSAWSRPCRNLLSSGEAITLPLRVMSALRGHASRTHKCTAWKLAQYYCCSLLHFVSYLPTASYHILHVWICVTYELVTLGQAHEGGVLRGVPNVSQIEHKV